MKKEKILKLSILMLGVIGILFIIGITYAFFVANGTGDEENILSSSCFNLELSVTNIISEGNIPMTDANGVKTKPYSFFINNICDISAEVGINLDILKTTNANLSNYKISISNGVTLAPTLINDLESDDISNEDTLLTKKLGSVYIEGNSQKKIDLHLWMKDSVATGEGENEIIESKISLSATAVPVQFNEVQEKIIADNGGLVKIRGRKTVNLEEISPAFLYEETPATEDNTKTTIRADVKNKYADSYSFNSEGGIYTLNSPVSEALSEKHIGMYTCKDNNDSCTTLYKVKEVEINPNKEGYSIGGPTEKTLSGTSTLAGNKTVGKSFHLDQSTGLFVLEDTISNVSFTEEYLGYYICASTATGVAVNSRLGCRYVHQILEVQSDPGEGNYYSKETQDSSVSFASSANKTVATDYQFDNETGTFTLINPETSVSYSTDQINYYTCNTNEATCTTLYKIKEVADSTVVKADQYVKTTRYNRLTKANTSARVINNSYINLTDKYTGTDVDYIRKNTGLFLGEDDFGDTYYFRGGNDWNNLFFAGYYWNIIRINGDGSLRLIYRGTTPSAIGEETQIESNYFNSLYSDNAYVGYMYGDSNNAHQNKNNSNIKLRLEAWYEKELLDYNDYIVDTIFCNDRGFTTEVNYGNTWDYNYGYGKEKTKYNGYYRIRNLGDFSSTFKCSQANDRFTVSNSYGNQMNKYPIGLITADEVSFAGITYKDDSTYNYLNTGISYWTMTPERFDSSATVHVVRSAGNLGKNMYSTTRSENGIRPVINLKGNVILSGTGTLEDPYRVEGLQTE